MPCLRRLRPTSVPCLCKSVVGAEGRSACIVLEKGLPFVVKLPRPRSPFSHVAPWFECPLQGNDARDNCQLPHRRSKPPETMPLRRSGFSQSIGVVYQAKCSTCARSSSSLKPASLVWRVPAPQLPRPSFGGTRCQRAIFADLAT